MGVCNPTASSLLVSSLGEEALEMDNEDENKSQTILLVSWSFVFLVFSYTLAMLLANIR
jgi:hypothetical protein